MNFTPRRHHSPHAEEIVYMMRLRDLTPSVRARMLDEIAADRAARRLYSGKRLTPRGHALYPDLLERAAREGTPETLAAALRAAGCMQPSSSPRAGRLVIGTVGSQDRAQTLAEGEFNRFYMRAVCLEAIARGMPVVQIYRAKRVQEPRPRSQMLIGGHKDAEALLRDLRVNVGESTESGVPGGPNSGLSVSLLPHAAAS
jgi:hypothetical protein